MPDTTLICSESDATFDDIVNDMFYGQPVDFDIDLNCVTEWFDMVIHEMEDSNYRIADGAVGADEFVFTPRQVRDFILR